MDSQNDVTEPSTAAIEAPKTPRTGQPPELTFRSVGVQAMTVSLGPTLAAAYFNDSNAEVLIKRLDDVRREVAREVGVVMPGVHLRDDIWLGESDYTIHVRDRLRGKGKIRIEHELMLGNAAQLEKLSGEDTKEPVYNLPAKWIAPADKDEARGTGGLVFDGISVLASHIGQVARDYMYVLFGYQECSALLNHMRTKCPALITELEARYSLPDIRQTYTMLLKEKVWPRDPVTVFEVMIETPDAAGDPRRLAEAARSHLVAPMLARRKLTNIKAATLATDIEAQLVALDKPDFMRLSGENQQLLREHIVKYNDAMPIGRRYVVCKAVIRRALRDFVEKERLGITVFAFEELPEDLQVDAVYILGNRG